ncbi:hypothetical protein L1987_23980 [Smallanthus sonchifolius]|uniref:Uncharacterized protein n=1 Tax=Smallanthus sonchifolius TaxID=185202 RepID=A0ACB9IJD6_9ASTR|nr:hypothetical protein L1987_23980 [Smallanthus sonchifolius]
MSAHFEEVKQNSVNQVLMADVKGKESSRSADPILSTSKAEEEIESEDERAEGISKNKQLPTSDLVPCGYLC